MKELITLDINNGTLDVNNMSETSNVYLVNTSSFYEACRNNHLEVVKLLLEQDLKCSIIEGINSAIVEGANLCAEYLLQLPLEVNIAEEDLILNFKDLITTTILHNDEMFDLVISKIPDHIKEELMKYAFWSSCINANINILQKLQKQGYYFTEIDNKSTVEILLTSHNGSREQIIKIYKWLDENGIVIKEDDLLRIVNKIYHKEFLDLILSTLKKKSNTVKERLNFIETLSQISRYVSSLIDNCGIEIIDTLIEYGMTKDQILKSVKNVDFLYENICNYLTK